MEVGLVFICFRVIISGIKLAVRSWGGGTQPAAPYNSGVCSVCAISTGGVGFSVYGIVCGSVYVCMAWYMCMVCVLSVCGVCFGVVCVHPVYVCLECG